MSGTINIARDLWDDPTFTDSEMSQREAWIWLIAAASWKPRARKVGSTEVQLERGQLVASLRFMARAWMWSEPRVRRYLDMLENRRMIVRAIDAGHTVITICKYDEYQAAPRVADAAPTQQATRARRTSDANYNKGVIREEDSSLRAGRFSEFWDSAYPHRGGAKRGRQKAEVAYAKAVRSGVQEQAIIEAARRLAHDRRVVDGYAQDPSTWLNQRGWEDDIEPVKPRVVTSYDPKPGDERIVRGIKQVFIGGGCGWIKEVS